METQYRSLLVKFHLITFIIVVGNYILHGTTNYSLSSNLALAIKILFYISGVILYFLHRKPFNEISLYFSLFVFGPLVTIVGWLTLYIGMFLTMAYIMFFSPWEKVKQEDDYIIYKEPNKFMSLGNKYRITEGNIFYEKTIADFKIDHENPISIHVKRNDPNLQVEYKYEKYSLGMEKLQDTIIYIALK